MKQHAVPGLRILILAAGFSSRLGQSKALARIHGQPLLRRTARLLAPFSRRPLIVIAPPKSHRFRHELRSLRTQIVANPARSQGLSASLRLGIARARGSSATLIVPVDLAALGRADLLRLIGRWRAARRKIVARKIDAFGGVPLILPVRFYDLARRARGDTGLRELLRRIDVVDRLWVDLPSAVADIDTPQDLRRARRAKIPRQRLPV